jgi:hypothetical protein
LSRNHLPPTARFSVSIDLAAAELVSEKDVCSLKHALDAEPEVDFCAVIANRANSELELNVILSAIDEVEAGSKALDLITTAFGRLRTERYACRPGGFGPAAVGRMRIQRLLRMD